MPPATKIPDTPPTTSTASYNEIVQDQPPLGKYSEGGLVSTHGPEPVEDDDDNKAVNNNNNTESNNDIEKDKNNGATINVESDAEASSSSQSTATAAQQRRTRIKKKTTLTDDAAYPKPQQPSAPGTDLSPAIDLKLIKRPTATFRMKDIVDALIKASDKDRPSLILGLHERMWHAPEARLHPLLEAAGCPRYILAQIPEVLKTCHRCNQFARTMLRPMIRATMATHFNHMMQADSYVLFGQDWLLMIDELFRYKQTDHLPDKSFSTYLQVFMESWFRYFGPPSIITVDQEGSFAGTEFGMMCDKYHISRHLGGSDPEKSGRGGKHTATSIAERHIGLLKSTALKMHGDCIEQGIEVTKKLILQEAAMAHDLLLASFPKTCTTPRIPLLTSSQIQKMLVITQLLCA